MPICRYGGAYCTAHLEYQKEHPDEPIVGVPAGPVEMVELHEEKYHGKPKRTKRPGNRTMLNIVFGKAGERRSTSKS